MKKVSDTEYLLMEILWEENRELSLCDFVECCEKKGYTWVRTTISTFISKLMKKKVIHYRKQGKQFLYYPSYTRLEYQQILINNELKESVNMPLTELILTFTGNTITQEGIERVRNYLKELEK